MTPNCGHHQVTSQFLFGISFLQGLLWAEPGLAEIIFNVRRETEILSLSLWSCHCQCDTPDMDLIIQLWTSSQERNFTSILALKFVICLYSRISYIKYCSKLWIYKDLFTFDEMQDKDKVGNIFLVKYFPLFSRHPAGREKPGPWYKYWLAGLPLSH